MRRYLFGMQLPLPVVGLERAAAILEAVILAALAALCLHLYRRYRKPYFAWWAAAWGLYVLRIGAIISFLHHRATGLALLAPGRHRLDRARPALGRAGVLRQPPLAARGISPGRLFPPVWSYIAIYRLDHFLWAALPAVLFLSLATLWTGWVFFRLPSTGSAAAAPRSWPAAFLLWGIHHLDYPFLRAHGAWTPWGYYLDILFALAVGAGILLLVLDDLRRGLGALGALSGDLQRAGGRQDVLAALLARPLTLPAVRGQRALRCGPRRRVRCVRGAGACANWPPTPPPELAAAARPGDGPAGRRSGQRLPRAGARDHLYAAVLPVFRGTRRRARWCSSGDARDPVHRARRALPGGARPAGGRRRSRTPT